MKTSAPKAKDKYVWRPPALTPPTIYVRISRVRKHGGCVSAECWQQTSNGVKTWKRAFPLPLPSSMERMDWTFDEIGWVAPT